MPLATTLLACMARLFACHLHLGGRILDVHGALLRTLLVRESVRFFPPQGGIWSLERAWEELETACHDTHVWFSVHPGAL